MLSCLPMTCAIEARCKHFGVCGGCKSQHIPYDEQLEMKERFVEELFGSCNPIIGCEEAWRWRNKMEFTFSENRHGERFLGLLMRGQRGKVVSLEECHICPEWMIEVLHTVYAWWQTTSLHAYFPPGNVGSLRTLTLREGIYTGEKMVVLTVSGEANFAVSEEELLSFSQALEGYDSVILRTQHLARKTPTTFTERLLVGKDHLFEILHDQDQTPYTFKIRAPSFFQPNTLQAERLYQSVIESLDHEPLLLDLYCGTGTIGIFASKKAQQVIGIESVAEAAEDAQVNLALNRVSNMTILQGEVEKRLEGLPAPSAVIVDPPRVGLTPKALQMIQSLRAQKIIYISCNPASQKKNIDLLEGYEVVRVQPFDQFPHTTHLENIVCLELI